MRPIDADTIFPNGHVLVWEKDGETTANYILKFIKDAPTLDVEPVRHGRWEFEFMLSDSNFYRCSECNRQEVLLAKESIYEYCPYCHCGERLNGRTRLL